MQNWCSRQQEEPRTGSNNPAQPFKSLPFPGFCTERKTRDSMSLIENHEGGFAAIQIVFEHARRAYKSQTRIFRRHKKLGGKFLLPLPNQMVGDHDQDIGVHGLVQDVLTNQDSGLDRLTQSDFVGQKITLNGISQHSTNDRDLMFKQFNGRRCKTGESPKGGALLG
jgi:hypothetical protein